MSNTLLIYGHTKIFIDISRKDFLNKVNIIPLAEIQ
jgi:hypothetical protein